MNEGPAPGPRISVDDAAAALAKRRLAAPNGAAPANGATNGAAAPAEPAAPASQPPAEGRQANADTLERLMAQLRGPEPAAPAPGAGPPGATPPPAAAPVDGIELNIGGQLRRFSQAELAAEVSKGQDYTRKMQELAAKQRDFAEQQRALEQLLPSVIPELQRQVKTLEEQIGEDTDWEALYNTDREEYFRRDAIRKNYEAQEKRLSKMQQVQEAENQRRMAAVREAGHNYLAERVPMWKDPVERTRLTGEIMAYGREMGLNDQELKSVLDPRYVHILLHALAWRNTNRAINSNTPFVPVVQRGSAPRQAGGNGAAAPLEEAFQQRSNIDNAVQVLVARRAAAARGGRMH
jgi:hypothetical protein